ncbi:hypothetical protein DVZ84_37100 [Streptomyces parvulus]|uniref:Uncharacterized protein n=1 Tax=Streptomyces parvulus TaxID=146923 RepID=A0A369UTI6_9ACTN|nr:hypothetical protein NI25_06580 [Streptomyces sp. CCM_MD2014]RDD84072.1 hypothetical protein DVZ84_37100 [Streptomyces parvulus]
MLSTNRVAEWPQLIVMQFHPRSQAFLHRIEELGNDMVGQAAQVDDALFGDGWFGPPPGIFVHGAPFAPSMLVRAAVRGSLSGPVTKACLDQARAKRPQRLSLRASDELFQ